MNKTSLQEQMLSESECILSSIDWYEAQLKEKLIDFDHHFRYNNSDKILVLEPQILTLVKKLSIELENMDRYMEKYRRLINDEKKAFLHYIEQKKEENLRSISKKQGRVGKGKGLQGKVGQG